MEHEEIERRKRDLWSQEGEMRREEKTEEEGRQWKGKKRGVR